MADIDSRLWVSLIAAVALLSLAGAWLLVRRSRYMRSVLERHLWIDTAANLVIIPLVIFGTGRVATRVMDAFGFGALAAWSHGLMQLLLAVAIAVGLGRVLEVWISVANANEDHDGHLPQLFRLILYGVCVIAGLAVFLTVNGYRPTELYLSTGVIAAIVAFASQQTLGDFFSGLTLSLERPFKLGDWIMLEDGTQGGVIDINWRTTRLRQWDNATLIVPNSVLAKTRIRNLHDKSHGYSPWYYVHVSAAHDPRAVKVLLLEAVLRCKRTVPGTVPTIRLSDATKAPYKYMIWVHFANYQAMFAGREELFREIHDGLAEAGIQVAIDMQEVRLSRASATHIEPPNVLTALKSVDFAGFLDDTELGNIAAMSQRSFFETGSVILDEGHRASCVYIITSGVVEVTVPGQGQRRRLVEEMRPGQYFGLAAMLVCEPAAMRYSARTDVSIIRVDIDCFRKIVAGRETITEQFAELLHRRRQLADEVRTVSPQAPHQTVTFQDIVRRIDRVFRSGAR